MYPVAPSDSIRSNGKKDAGLKTLSLPPQNESLAEVKLKQGEM